MKTRGGLAVLMLVACGADPRTDFVGSYSGVGTRTWADGEVFSFDTTFTVTAPERSDRIEVHMNGCTLTANAVSDETAQFDPSACPTIHGVSVGGTMADFTDAIQDGTATLTNKTLTIAQEWTQTGTHYANGDPNQTFYYRRNVTATKTEAVR